MKSDREKMKHHRNIGILIGIAGIVLGVMTAGSESLILTYLGMATALGGMIYMQVHMRCPHCKKFFNFRIGIPDYCHYCGKRID